VDSKKILLKKLASRILPDNFVSNRKQGFSIPLQEWLKNKNLVRDHFFDILTSSDSFFDKKTIIALFKEQDKGRNNSERLFALFQFELWRKQHNAHL
jgi:asparagine synthase (glutamine-hydrolysing)